MDRDERLTRSTMSLRRLVGLQDELLAERATQLAAARFEDALTREARHRQAERDLGKRERTFDRAQVSPRAQRVSDNADHRS